MHLYKTTQGNILVDRGQAFIFNQDWDTLINQENLHRQLGEAGKRAQPLSKDEFDDIIKKNKIGNHIFIMHETISVTEF